MQVGRGAWLTAGALVGFAALTYTAIRLAAHAPSAPLALEPLPAATTPSAADAATEMDEDDRAYSFRVPSGEPAALSCDAARAIVSQARGGLAYDADPIAPRAFALDTADWLDPHGLWSAARDAPIDAVLVQHGARLVHELESPVEDDCGAAREVGVALVSWVAELAKRYDAERAAALGRSVELPDGRDDAVFEVGEVTHSARDLAATLGRHVGAVERRLGPLVLPYVSAARGRYFPPLDADGWAKVVLAAAVRAYVQLIDPHGAWAPFDEEASVYEVDLESHPPDHLWDRATRTALGIRIDSDPVAPLEVGDLVLSLAGLPTAGLPLEQIEQLGYAATETSGPVIAVVLRHGEANLRTLTIPAEVGPGPASAAAADDLEIDRVPYGAGDALIIAVPDVRDDLGDELVRALERERTSDTRPLQGVVLDLRGNGGGSTEGAIAGLGLFLPGVTLFPMKRRDGTVETDRAPEPPLADRWVGPVATLVDADTASAAEMIAGALAVYRRGPSVGTTTYGKGCAQEYVDDEARTGVLRLTTLLYALPDGTPVQRTGLAPTILLPLGAPNPASPVDREATLPHAPPSWRGPDVRDWRAAPPFESTFAWPPNAGSVGPCKDPDVCRALRALGNGGRRLSTAKATTGDGPHANGATK